MIIHPKVRGFICTTAHPVGCAKNVLEQIERVRAGASAHPRGPKRVLVIGASTGYGLASRITAAFGYAAATLGVFFEKPSSDAKTGTAGWYNAAAFDKFAKQAGVYARSVNGDAFSHATRAEVIRLIREEMDGAVDLVVYSLASPVRKHPDSGELTRSALKTIGESFTELTVDTNRDTVVQTTVEPASEAEIADTVTVMGGEDWALWIDALSKAGVLAKHAKTVAFSYVGTEITWPIYWHGALGRAKQHLDRTAGELRDRHADLGLQAQVGVMKSVVTQASAAIPVLPLYIAIAFQIMKEKGLHEGTLEQAQRLFQDFLYRPDGVAGQTDEQGRLRLDDRELRQDVQSACKALWPTVTTENLREYTDYDGYKREFLRLFGFARDDVDYDADVSANVRFDVIEL